MFRSACATVLFAKAFLWRTGNRASPSRPTVVSSDASPESLLPSSTYQHGVFFWRSTAGSSSNSAEGDIAAADN
jgi:hypothetical protein